MDKYGLYEIGTTHVRLTLATGKEGENFYIYKTLSENVLINEHIAADELIKSAKMIEVFTTIKFIYYRKGLQCQN